VPKGFVDYELDLAFLAAFREESESRPSRRILRSSDATQRKVPQCPGRLTPNDNCRIMVKGVSLKEPVMTDSPSSNPAVLFLTDLVSSDRGSRVWSGLSEGFLAESRLLEYAASVEYHFSSEQWQSAVADVVKEHFGPRRHEEIIRLLQEPTSKHRENLREWVFEVVDYEGDPAWTPEEDYQHRVEHILPQLVADSGYEADGLTDLQMAGQGWGVMPFGLSTDGPGTRTLISWTEISDVLNRIL